jgi:hypothetical protein
VLDNQKRCGVGKTCWSFQFVQHSIESDTTVGEGVHVGHHPLQPKHHQNCNPRNFYFHHLKDNGQDVPPIGIGYYQNIGQADQQEGEG